MSLWSGVWFRVNVGLILLIVTMLAPVGQSGGDIECTVLAGRVSEEPCYSWALDLEDVSGESLDVRMAMLDSPMLYVAGDRDAGSGSDFVALAIDLHAQEVLWEARWDAGLGLGDWAYAAAYSPDAGLLVVGGELESPAGAADSSSALVAFDTDDGAVRWANVFPTDLFPIQNLAVSPDGQSVVAAAAHRAGATPLMAFAFDLRTGNQSWAAEASSNTAPFNVAYSLSGSKLFLIGQRTEVTESCITLLAFAFCQDQISLVNRIFALDPEDGSTIWSAENPAGSGLLPTSGGGVVTHSAAALKTFNSDGGVRWESDGAYFTVNSPDAARLFAVRGGLEHAPEIPIRAIDGDTGEVVWEAWYLGRLGGVAPGMVADDTQIYASSGGLHGEAAIVRFDSTTGRLLGEVRTVDDRGAQWLGLFDESNEVVALTGAVITAYQRDLFRSPEEVPMIPFS